MNQITKFFFQILVTGIDTSVLIHFESFSRCGVIPKTIPKTIRLLFCSPLSRSLTIFAVDGLDHQICLEGVLHLLPTEMVQVLLLDEVALLFL